MKVYSSTRVSDSLSDNRQSKSGAADQKRPRGPKWLGVVALVLAFPLCGAVAEAQQQAKLAKIGFLTAGATPGTTEKFFGRDLRALGYVEGKHIAVENRSAENKLDRLPVLAEELVRLNVDLLVTSATTGALALKNATRTIPIVFFIAGDPIEAGLVDSLPRPGGNITGFTNIAPELAGKRLELLKETVPKLTRVALLWDPRIRGSEQSWKESQLAGRQLGLQLHSMEVGNADKFESAFEEAIKAGSTALAAASSSLFNTHKKRIADLAAKNRLPAIFDGETLSRVAA